MRILLTGATGYVGFELLKTLLKCEYNIAILIRNSNNALEELDSKYELIYTSEKEWKTKIKKFDPHVVIHLAAFLTSLDDEGSIVKLIDSNILYGTHLLDALKGTSIHTFINTGTFAEYNKNDGNLVPAYLYAATKSAFRNIISYYQNIGTFKVINVIPYTIYGGKDTKRKLIDIIYESLDSVDILNMSPGDQRLDFIHLKDVIEFYLLLLSKLSILDKEIYDIHLGTGIGSTPKQIANLFEKATGKKAHINWGGMPYRPTDTMYSVAPLSDLKRLLNWEPNVSLKEGISLYLNLHKKIDGV